MRPWLHGFTSSTPIASALTMGHSELPSCAAVHLAPHIHFCRTKGQVVFLDLKRNKYLGVAAADADALSRWVEELSKQTQVRQEDGVDEDAASRLLREMIDAGMLTAEVAGDGMREQTCPPSTALIDGYAEVSTSIGARDVMHFAAAAVRASLLLRLCSLEKIARRVSARRRRHASTASAHERSSADRLAQLVAAFAKLRTFAFTASNECLFDSLALIEFLACYSIFPNWVFGVATSPFVAHCWLQQDEMVINDSPEHVGWFTRIMVL